MRPHSLTSLPAGYRLYDHVNLQQDKKTSLAVNIAAAVLMIALFVLGHFAFVPLSAMFDVDALGMGTYLLHFAVLLLGYFAYIILHELTHAAVMKLFGGTRLRFGFTGLYAYAGSEVDYFDKLSYLCVALAPLTVWGVIFTVLLIFTPAEWFWVVYFWQVGNIAGAAGDVYVTCRFIRAPKDILVMDTGVEMSVYSKTPNNNAQNRIS